MKSSVFLCALVSAFALSGCNAKDENTKSIEPKHPIKHQAMIVTANPHATQAGLDILRAGGSAVDAAIAVESVLSLVEPQSSGLAGGAFMVHYDNKTKEIAVYDGRETAPAGATADMFLQEDGKRLPFIQAKTSGLSTCLLYTSPSPRDLSTSRMPSSA